MTRPRVSGRLLALLLAIVLGMLWWTGALAWATGRLNDGACAAASGFGAAIGNEAIERYGCRMMGGLGLTLQLVGISTVIGMGFALLLAAARLWGGSLPGGFLLSGFSTGYTTFFRGTPLLAQVFLVYYGAGQIRPFLESIGLWASFRDAFFCAAFTFTLNTAAYQAEVFRGAIQSVPRGQWEAARSLGMRPFTIFRKVVMPQAAMVALRPLGNELVIMVKSSAVASLVTLLDLMGSTRFAFARSFDLMVYVFAAMLYLAIVEIIRRVWDIAEQRLTRHLHHA